MFTKRFITNIFAVALLLLVSCVRQDTLFVPSQAMNKNIKTRIVLPQSYSNAGEPFPVLYLLHGYGGDYVSWVQGHPYIKELANKYRIIIVCPDGDFSSWYFDSPIDSSIRYETFVTSELTRFIDKSFNTIKSTKGRAITGFSMGGHGAFYLALRNQDVFGAAGSISGGLDIRPFTGHWDIDRRLGSINKYPHNWEEHTVINLIYLAKNSGLKLIFDCGTSDFFIDVNRALHKKMEALDIPHQYIERPGGHTGEYIASSLPYQINFFSNFFGQVKQSE